MAKIVVIGGTGFISQRLVWMLVNQHHQVTLLNRGRTPSPFRQHPNLSIQIGDRNDPSVLQSVFDQERYDIVYDFVGYEPQQMEAVVANLPGKIGRYIFCSTISVYMISEQVECPITEDQDHAPIMPFWDRNPFGMDYGIKKRECEDILWAAHDEQTFPVSVLRPTFVCGPGDPTQRDYFWIQRILDGRPLLVPGDGNHAYQHVYIDDVARAFLAVPDKAKTIGEAYNVASEEVFTLIQYLQRLGELLGVSPELVHIPQEKFDELAISQHHEGDVFPFNTRREAVFSLDKIKEDLGYRSTPFRGWMPETIRWYREECEGNSIGYERRAEELEIIQQLKRKDS